MSAHTFVIAEAGVNHNGSLQRAQSLVEVAAQAGADAVKFQTFKADEVATAAAPKAAYQRAAGESQLEMIRGLELDRAAFVALAEHAAASGIEFMSTPFDRDSAAFLAELGVRRMKVASGEITNGPLLLAIARFGLPIVLSTGMSTLADIEAALGVIAFGISAEANAAPSRAAFAEAYADDRARALLAERVTLLHCTTEYPAPLEDVNLRAMDTMRATFGLAVGYSDHTRGIAIALAAVARGAACIEKHFTLDRSLPGPDHAASLEPGELAEMVSGIRSVEAALGAPDKAPAPSERANMAVARRSLVAARDIAPGERFSAETLAAKRPGTGLSPMNTWDLIGRSAPRAFRRDEIIEP